MFWYLVYGGKVYWLCLDCIPLTRMGNLRRPRNADGSCDSGAGTEYTEYIVDIERDIDVDIWIGLIWSLVRGLDEILTNSMVNLGVHSNLAA